MQEKTAGFKQLVDEFLGKNMAPIHADLAKVNLDVTTTKQLQKRLAKEYALQLAKAKADYPSYPLSVRSWANIPRRTHAIAQAKVNKGKGMAAASDQLEKLVAEQAALNQKLHTAAAKSLRTRALGVTLPAAAIAGAVYLKKKHDANQQRDEARQAYFASLNKS